MMDEMKNKKKQKLTLNTVGLVLMAVVVVAIFYVWKANAAAEVQTVTLSDNISQAQAKMRGIPVPEDGLETRLDEVKAELAAVRQDFPATVDRNGVIDYILKVADNCGVQVLPLVSEGWAVENIGQSYRVLSITAKAEGSLANVESFMQDIQNGRYPTLTIPELAISRIGASGIYAAESEIQVSVDMKIGIYTYSAAPGEDSV